MNKKTPKQNKAADPELAAKDKPLAVYPSIKHCAGATGIPVRHLRMAKRNGAPAFDANGRVKLLPLLRYLFANTPDGGVDWDVMLKKERTLFVQRQRENLEGKLVPIVEVERGIAEVLQLARQTLLQELTVNLPPKLEGLRTPEITLRMSELFDRVMGIYTNAEKVLNHVEPRHAS